MPPQIFRLVILTAGVVGSYGIARMLMVPPTFGEHGSYRGAALEELAAAKPVFSGIKACDECHSEVLEELVKFEHKTISCESCHGPSRKHAADPDVTTPKGKFADSDCLRCHQSSPSRPVWLKQVDPNEHYRGDKRCSACHLPHQPNEKP
ncbi:MAG: hypothetical protein HY736_02450 [Verrucomicrobia bacterium]|nr:hypothetical protein [Verrucomicrobiota bacterium]